MYAVVGCGECEALWVLEGDPDRSECPRCGTTRKHAKRRTFVETEDADHAREVRASMLATRQGHGDEFASLGSFAELADRLDEAGPDDETYLRESGLDPEAVEAAGDRASGNGTRTSRADVVRNAIRELDDPSREAVHSYAADRGVDPDYVTSALRKLVDAGEVAENRDTLRLL